MLEEGNWANTRHYVILPYYRGIIFIQRCI